MENDNLRDKLDQCSREYHHQINELETELSEIKGIKEKLHRYWSRTNDLQGEVFIFLV